MDPIVELLREPAPAVPPEMTAIVLCDRGISSPKLWQQVHAQGGQRLPARAFLPGPDTTLVGSGAAFGPPTAKRHCTLLAVWYAEQEEPWIIPTDLPPEEVAASWYALRFWIELGFKAIKSMGWKWNQTRRRIRPVSPATGWCCR